MSVAVSAADWIPAVRIVPVVAVKVAVVLPAATVAEGGTLSAGLLLASDTVSPPEGAAWLSVTVQVEELPEGKVVGLQASAETTGAVRDIVKF